MRTFFVLFTTSILTLSAQAGIDCNVIKTPYYLLKTKSAVTSLMSCRDSKCIKKSGDKAELNFCKAVSKCEPLRLELNDPCLEDYTFTPEAREYLLNNAASGLNIVTDAAIDLVKDIKNRITGKETEIPTEEEVKLSCDKTRAGYFIYEAQKEAKELASCKKKSCIEKRAAKTENLFCQAVNHCEALSVELDNPCLPSNHLTPEAREDLFAEMKKVAEIIENIIVSIFKGL
jgi:hypothetical protein